MAHKPVFLFDNEDVVGAFDEAGPRGNPLRVAVIGNSLPKKCGIATFTGDLIEQLEKSPSIKTDLVAMCDPEDGSAYPGARYIIPVGEQAAYATAARLINVDAPDAVWLQHEFGIFGGRDGEYVCDLIDGIAAPLVLTLHTVLQHPSANQMRIMRHLISRASRIMVMSQHSRDLLAKQYEVSHDLMTVIEHGAPDRPFGRQEEFKGRFGLTGKTVLMTFGLIGPGKGLERAITALPMIRERHPDLIYRIVGATHPNLVAREGEAYRNKLERLADEHGVADIIEWDDRFLDTPDLLDQLETCDIYLTPYSNMDQSTSGTLSYAVALGKAVVSTPYVHASELLADGVGALLPSNDSIGIANEVIALLDDPDRLKAMQERAYARGRETVWPRYAEKVAALVRSAAAPRSNPSKADTAPGLSAVFTMCDDTGVLQHAIGTVPDRNHGYCLDDNARALMLITRANGIARAERTKWSMRFAGFIQHAWNPDAKRFRNFMSFDRRWCEDEGSDDSNGRAFWALGSTIEHARSPDIRDWAIRWYDTALPSLRAMESPRALAFVMLGAAARLRVQPDHRESLNVLRDGANTLVALLGKGRRPDWAWFEIVLGYDNPRLSQALIEAASFLNDDDAAQAGLETLQWIADRQTSSRGHFRPIGSESFGRELASLPFDQQPLEAQAAIEGAAAAICFTGDEGWKPHAQAAWNWFFGANDRGVILADVANGRCRDGINPRGRNENCGAESILAFQLSYYSMLAMFGERRRARVGERIEPASQFSH